LPAEKDTYKTRSAAPAGRRSFDPHERGRPTQPRGKPYGKPPYGKSYGKRGPQRTVSPELQAAVKHLKQHFEIRFYPEESAFVALSTALQKNCKTYQLFRIAELLLEKPERFVAIVRPRKAKTTPTAAAALSGGPRPKLYCSVPDGCVFESEAQALSHVMTRHLELFFDTHVTYGEGPRGHFPFVYRCGLTQLLIGPPNYHRYGALLQAHYETHLKGQVSMERFQSLLQADRSPEALQQWSDQMRQITHYCPKANLMAAEQPDAAPVWLPSLEAAKQYLAQHAKGQAVRVVRVANIPGAAIELMAQGPLRQAIQDTLAQERRFPLDTANHIRARLRRIGFFVYKKGIQGTSYACAVRRRWRHEGQLAPNCARIMDLIEQQPLQKAQALACQALGLRPGRDLLSLAAHPDYKAFAQDLRHLIAQGYVIEYENGTLWVPRVPSKLKARTPQ
jgi:hypothetical protein